MLRRTLCFPFAFINKQSKEKKGMKHLLLTIQQTLAARANGIHVVTMRAACRILCLALFAIGMLDCVACSSDSHDDDKPVICPVIQWQPGDTLSAEVLAYGVDAFFVCTPIPDSIFAAMQGKSFKANCTVPRDSLRYIRCLHTDKDGNSFVGEMVLNRSIAEQVLGIFRKLYDAKYPIERMLLIDRWDADDEMAMRDNNSSSFNFRFISHTQTVSKHGKGLAVDINTLYNPYHKFLADGTEIIEPATGAPYLDRTLDFDYKIEKGDLCYQLFIAAGFKWGGDWTDRKDYQHFEK